MVTYVPIFFPSNPDEQDAIPIDLSPGAEVGNIDVTVFPVQRRLVRGVIIDGTTGQPTRNARLFVYRQPARINDKPYTGVDSTGGSFEVSSLLPGSYVLLATADDLTGRALIEVGDENVEDVTIALLPGVNISGRIVADGNRSSLAGLRVRLRPDPDIPDLKLVGPPENGIAASDGSFSLLAVPPGDYRLNVTFPPNLQGAYLKSVRLGSVDILRDGLRIAGQPAEPLEVIIGTNPGALQGRIVTAKLEPVPA